MLARGERAQNWAQVFHAKRGPLCRQFLRGSSTDAIESEFDEAIIKQPQLPFAGALGPLTEALLDRQDRRLAVLPSNEPIYRREKFHTKR